MPSFRFALAILLLASSLGRSEESRIAGLTAKLKSLSLDPENTYRVRDLEFSRGGVKFFLTEGVLSFAKAIDGKTVAAIFSTEDVEAGDAEIIALPPHRSERKSLAIFTKLPNLDEHFDSATFFFSDDTDKELLSTLGEDGLRKAPELGTKLAGTIDPMLRNVATDIELDLLSSFLDRHKPEDGFLYAALSGRTLGVFSIMYSPVIPEPVSIGRTQQRDDRGPKFQLWTEFRSPRAPRYEPEPSRFGNYVIDATVQPDLNLVAKASFDYQASPADGNTIRFELSDRLRVRSAEIDGRPAEFFERRTVRDKGEEVDGGAFLLYTDRLLATGTPHRVAVAYEGSVIRQVGGGYAVNERTTWYPQSGTVLANFDLTFRCPAQLGLISTGELISEEVTGQVRTAHRRTTAPVGLAGFNIGSFTSASEESGPYRVETYSTPGHAAQGGEIARSTGQILTYYSELWTPLPIHSLSVTPVPGYFGQGFPGLIYLSDVAYVPLNERPVTLRSPRLDAFFSSMLLPHEVAHQWWGSLVIPADYRTNWVVEALANYSALQYLANTQGAASVDAVLTQYREDLARVQNGSSVESAGPLDFGVRLENFAGSRAWHIITYEKGTWVMNMLSRRLGSENFRRLELRLLQSFRNRAVTTEDFRLLAASLVPAGQPDRDLRVFFDTWVYGTGLPRIQANTRISRLEFELSGVDDDFTVDIPLECRNRTGAKEARWVKAVEGQNSIALQPGQSCALPSPTSFLYLQP